MVNRNLMRQFDLPEAELAHELDQAFDQDIHDWLTSETQVFETNKIVKGKVLNIVGDDVLVDVGYKSEGIIKAEEFKDDGSDQVTLPQVGDEIEVLLETIEDEYGVINLSYRKAKRQKEWEAILAKHKEGDVVSGMVTRKIKGGLLVNIGVNVFLPASQVDIRRPPDIGDYINRTIECMSLKHKSESPWKGVEAKYPVNSRHTGEVVNIMSYGAFVKLEPGVEGLVHISEMSWTKRINHPSELVQIGDTIEVQVLNINQEKQEISLGMKQVQPNPWDQVAERYPPGTIISGTVRNLTNYGAFIEIEEGIDGLLHVSDMSWVRKVSHPSEVVQKGQKVTCVVLNVDQERKRVAQGLQQLANDPWEGDIPGRYKPGQVVKGKVTKLTNFGVFVELEPGLEGLLHISELADDKIESPEEVVKVGDDIEVKVLRVEPKDRKIGLSRKNLYGGPEPEEETGEAGPRP